MENAGIWNGGVKKSTENAQRHGVVSRRWEGARPGWRKTEKGGLDTSLRLTVTSPFGFMSTSIYLQPEKLSGFVFPSMDLFLVYRSFVLSQAWVCK